MADISVISVPLASSRLPYDFTSLLPADFEDLARDLTGKMLGVRFEAFGPGPDGGIDGRHARDDGCVVLQAKHYAGSSFSQLKTAMKKERASIDRLDSERYILATSRPLSPANKAMLAVVIGPALLREADILNQADLNQLLRDYPELEKAHLKLWLSSTAVLQTILEAIINAGSHAFTASGKAEIAAKVKVYAPNPSLAQAREVLDSRHVLIVSGPPGVGKTTLAEILTFAYLRDGWELVALRSLEDGFNRINDTKKQVFFFDDFLGSIALDHQALAAKDSELARFMQRVRKSPNARFILTTRAYILNEARQWSERIADRRVELSTYVLDLSSYTRAIRARILYNHLAIGGLPQSFVLALLNSGELPTIIDHENYNPRIVEWMTDVLGTEDISPDDYPAAFIDTLDNPTQLWEKAFRKHITTPARHLLIALFLSGRQGTDIVTLRSFFEAFHARLSADLGVARDPKDFEQSLKQLEGGFVAIEDRNVDFINPSVRDYLAGYLTDGALLPTAAATCTSATGARQIWTFAKEKLDWLALPALANAFVQATRHLVEASNDPFKDLDSSGRISLLLEWWAHSGEVVFADGALAIALTAPHGFAAWLDGARLLELIGELHDPGHHEPGQKAEEIADALEDVVVQLFEEGMGSDDLLKMSDMVENGYYSDKVRFGSHAAINREIEEIGDVVSNYTSESELDDHASVLRRLAPRAGVPEIALERALQTVGERIEEVQVAQAKSADPDVPNTEAIADNAFGDDALYSLFDSLR
jgi:DNA polymerase III delta prime subunit